MKVPIVRDFMFRVAAQSERWKAYSIPVDRENHRKKSSIKGRIKRAWQ